ncbi:hypothetical protein ACNO5M_13895 [Vibrio owensii]|uniref:hypothetical protein n=1 Tax=Vibrio owensii TaxID=696485 RepID=UPI003AAA8BFA
MNNTILGIYGIEIFSPSDGNGCVITSDMKELDCPENDTFNAAVDGLESLILGHFAAGVDVATSEYLEGIKAAYHVIIEQFS